MIVVLRGRDRRRQTFQAELVETGKETLELLVAKNPEHELGRRGRAAPCGDAQDQSGKDGVIKRRDRTPAPPFRFVG